MQFAQGLPVSELTTRPAQPGETRGTKVVFRPDPSIFKTTTSFEFDKRALRLDELAYLNAGLSIKLVDKRPKPTAAVLAQMRANRIAESIDGEDVSKVDAFDLGEEEQASVVQEADQVSSNAHSNLLDIVPGSVTKEVTFYHEGGIKELVSVLCEGKSPLLLSSPESESGGADEVSKKNEKNPASGKNVAYLFPPRM